MSYSDRSTSPDPLSRPASPLALRTRSGNNRRSSIKPLSQRSHNIVSPSKSFVMDTGTGGDASPWRIKVTVEAEPNQGSSPTRRMTRTTKVPLKGGSSSPTKKSTPAKKKAIADDETDREIKRPQRKRKGTPIRRTARRSQQPDDVEMESERQQSVPPGHIEMSAKLQEELSSPNKRPSPDRPGIELSEGAKWSRLPSRRTEGNKIALNDRVQTEGPSSEASHYSVKSFGDADMTVANEDFTMVSVETLESMKQNTSLLDHSGIDKSVASVSYMPSSPPQMKSIQKSRDTSVVGYPDIGVEATEARIASAESNRVVRKPIDSESAISAKRDGRGIPATNDYLSSEPSEWQAKRKEVSREIENASASQVIVIDDETQAGADDDRISEQAQTSLEEVDANGDELDIWAEEASRSLEESQDQDDESQDAQDELRPPQLDDLFSDQPLRPPRPKIPRTWRRTSGMDFSYVDSPEHGALSNKNPPTISTDEDNGGGVLTPPESSDDESLKPSEEESDLEEEADISLTRPDAAATQLENQHIEDAPRAFDATVSRPEVTSSASDSGSAVTSPEGEDTGLFWQANLPNVYRQPTRPRMTQRKKAMDLTELLNLDKTDPPVESGPSYANDAQSSHAADRPRSNFSSEICVDDRRSSVLSQQSKEKVVSSPLRKSLLKSSKIGGSVLPTPSSRSSNGTNAGQAGPISKYEDANSANDILDRSIDQAAADSFDDSLASKASDQRQLLMEMGQGSAVGQSLHSSRVHCHHEEEDKSVDYSTEVSNSFNTSRTIERSYEERLNLDSPQKIKVKFDDPDQSSDVLAPRKEYPPLFGSVSKQEDPSESPPSIHLVSKKSNIPSSCEPGFLSRLSTTFWSAVVRPSGPIMIDPVQEPTYPPTLRARIRNRYGVLSDQHPWTMTHMRTLHRLLNSCTSNKSDSIVPQYGPLPAPLENLIGKSLRCVGEFRWVFTEQHAHVVDAFTQLLVPAHYVEAMRKGDVEFIGDSEARKYRGLINGRHGDDPVFEDGLWFKMPRGKIERDFVVKALGNCVCANVLTAEKEAIKKTRIAEERRVWERRNGFVADDRQEGVDDVDSSGSS